MTKWSKQLSRKKQLYWFPRQSQMGKEYVGSCLYCAVGDIRNPPAPPTPRTRTKPGVPLQIWSGGRHVPHKEEPKGGRQGPLGGISVCFATKSVGGTNL